MEMQFDLLPADQFINQDGLFEAALKTIDRIGDDRNGLVLRLGELQHRRELFALAPR